MKTIRVILLSAFVSVGCYAKQVAPSLVSSELTSVSASLVESEEDSVANIRFDEVVTHGDLELRWLTVNDSRCPTGVNCVAAGEVKVFLEASHRVKREDTPVEIQLILRARGKPAPISVFGYELELVNVEPYPKNGVTPQRCNYLAVINLSRAVMDPGQDQKKP